MNQLGIVVIGRNEGDRLKHCLRSVVDQGVCVYVDSGSQDDSVTLAQSLEIGVVELDLSKPFTAARARNAGVKYLVNYHPDLTWVQFVDGDCEVVKGWLGIASMALKTHEQWAVVCGRRREKFPEKSVFNRLCDLEWNTPVGEAKACGGDFMVRLTAFQAVNGFNETLIAGEEPELCYRLRQQGWQVHRLDAEMTRHDAQMVSFTQWWKRAVRAGHAFTETTFLYPDAPSLGNLAEIPCGARRQLRNNVIWGLTVPILILGAGLISPWLSGFFLFAYPVYIFKIYQNQRQQGFVPGDARIYAFFCALGRFPSLQGQLLFYRNQWLGQKTTLIEYKEETKR